MNTSSTAILLTATTEQKMNATIITAIILAAIAITPYYQQSHLSGPPSRR